MNQKIYRYIDFAKFSKLLKNTQLHFHQAADFGDKFEGTVPEEVKIAQQREYEEAFKNGEIPQHGTEIHAEINRCLRKFTFLSCWHMQDTESVAMWEKYGGSSKAVAIQSTLDNLRRALLADDDTHRIYFGEVDYRAYQKGFEEQPEPQDIDPENLDDRFFLTRNPHSLAPFLYKRNGYSYEQEMRAIIQNPPTLDPSKTKGTKLGSDGEQNFDQFEDITMRVDNEQKYLDTTDEPRSAGISVDIYVDELIDTIHFAPDANSWFKRTVKKEMANCDHLGDIDDVDELVEDSILDDDLEPYF